MCQPTIIANMIRHQTSAITIRCLQRAVQRVASTTVIPTGGSMALISTSFLLLGGALATAAVILRNQQSEGIAVTPDGTRSGTMTPKNNSSRLFRSSSCCIHWNFSSLSCSLSLQPVSSRVVALLARNLTRQMRAISCLRHLNVDPDQLPRLHWTILFFAINPTRFLRLAVQISHIAVCCSTAIIGALLIICIVGLSAFMRLSARWF